MPIIKVDGKELQVKPGINLLEALLSAGIDLPYFCWHPAMGSVGACRQCAVVQYANEEDARGRIMMACMTPVTDNAIFSVDTDNAVSFRQSVIENLMLNHPHDCPVCEEGGECHLQDMTVMVGHHNRRYEGKKTTFRNQYLGPFIGHEMNRCITCYRCIRYYQDYSGGHDLAAFASRDRVFFGRAEDGLLENEFAGNLVEVCPTGVFTDKTLSKHYTRKWDLQSAPTICSGCSLGCNTYTSERYGELRRVTNRYHHDINGYFLCDRGRFGAGFVNSPDRIPQAGIRNDRDVFDPVPLDDALDQIKELISSSERAIGIGSPRASLEANQSLRELVGEDNYCNGMTGVDQELHEIIINVLQSELKTPSLAAVEEYDAILVLGEDITNHAPRLALSVRQATRNRAADMADKTMIAQWHDAAVRVLAQHERSPLIIATPVQDRLDEVATQSLRLRPSDIAQLGFSVANEIAGKAESGSSGSLKAIADMLLSARKPLIISGTGLQNADILRSAANLAMALSQHNPETGIFLCASESNSIGVALIDNRRSIKALLASVPDLVIVLENDLSARLGHEFTEFVESTGNLVVLDHLDTDTTTASHIVLPAATFAEAEGTFVNNEGRAQRSMAVFEPKGDIQASYHLLDALAGRSRSISQIRQSLVAAVPALDGIIEAAPEADFRFEGSKFSRMTHRASGRTAIAANISVHEPKQSVDHESAMAFTMEGNQQQAPASLRAYTWSPGWNSNQSIHKFQHEVGGSDLTGDPGKLLIDKSKALTPYEPSVKESGTLIRRFHIFGSEEMSAYADELSRLIPQPYISLHSKTAADLNVDSGDGLSCNALTRELRFTVVVDDAVPEGCFAYPVMRQTYALNAFDSMTFSRINDWSGARDPLTPNLITSDRRS